MSSGNELEDALYTSQYNTVMAELVNLKQEVETLRTNIDEQEKEMLDEMKALHDQLNETKVRQDNLEYQINAMSELRQAELSELRHTIDEKHDIMEYQGQEKVQDLGESIISLETRISKLEHQTVNNQG